NELRISMARLLQFPGSWLLAPSSLQSSHGCDSAKTPLHSLLLAHACVLICGASWLSNSESTSGPINGKTSLASRNWDTTPLGRASTSSSTFPPTTPLLPSRRWPRGHRAFVWALRSFFSRYVPPLWRR